FSPDGKHIVFSRGNDPEIGKFQILTENADGTNAKLLYGGPASESPYVLAWSPDGRQIASLLGYARGALSAIDLADIASVEEHRHSFGSKTENSMNSCGCQAAEDFSPPTSQVPARLLPGCK